ncbi:hypothetical protein [Saccharothrix coeruleofusca]|uniref:Uncharacterized protein n=1 Tax=Saccharothrix coeruleofusca TaxID=33919 RepID=A0A918ATP3_9PSEU|nr:hypothetical protein [Saccharothrix coeruleofusca]MBP2336819.1 hypothetical protein [Saccharothrix coeruleofusca]GGP82792.1 hypothetical protein GCM10010185_66050 [Saccharothrix coeruleofusca]
MPEVHCAAGRVLVVVDPEGTPGERAVARLAELGYEGDGVLHLSRTDGWAERRLRDGVLVVDVLVRSAALESLGVDAEAFTERSRVDRRAVRLLRVRGEAAEGERLPDATTVVAVPPGTPVRRVLADLDSGVEWPLVLAPPQR